MSGSIISKSIEKPFEDSKEDRNVKGMWKPCGLSQCWTEIGKISSQDTHIDVKKTELSESQLTGFEQIGHFFLNIFNFVSKQIISTE